MRRVYRKAEAVERETDGPGGGFGVALDGRGVRTPGKAPLSLPTLALAEAIATEWRDQGDNVVPATMPMMQLAATAIDRVVPQPDAVAGEIAGFGASALLCYRADGPAELAARQAKAWQPMLDWAAGKYGARLILAEGVVPVAQPEDALARLDAAVRAFDAFRLAPLHVLVSITGSLILGLAVLEGEIWADDAFQRARIDEDWQAKHWGADAEAAKRRDMLLAECVAATKFLVLLDR